VRGFKCFLSPSGVEEFGHVSEADLRGALPILARLDLPLLVHAELPAALRDMDPGGAPRAYRTWLDSRPPDAEHAAIDLLVRLAREFSARIHVVHLASAEALPRIAAARAEGLRVTVETCPHYLAFAAEDIRDGATAFKCAPPIRGRSHREGLWAGLRDGRIDLVATDHSPAPAALKLIDEGDFVRAWGGIASLQLGLAAVWTAAAGRGVGIDRVASLMAAAPAALAGLGSRKGSIDVGRDADLAICDPDAELVVDAGALHHRHPVTPYAGRRLRGRVHQTLLRGEVVFDDGRFAAPPRGRPLLANQRVSG
jgi:allantoinase